MSEHFRELHLPAALIPPSRTCSLVPPGGLVREECPLGLDAFLSTRPPIYIRPCSLDFMDGGATDVPILGPMELKKIAFLLYFLKSYRLADYRTFYGLKIGPLLAEIQPLFCWKVKFYTYHLKTTFKNMSFNLFFQPTDLLEIIEIGKTYLIL